METASAFSEINAQMNIRGLKGTTMHAFMMFSTFSLTDLFLHWLFHQHVTETELLLFSPMFGSAGGTPALFAHLNMHFSA